jgi:hypothetical protein
MLGGLAHKWNWREARKKAGVLRHMMIQLSFIIGLQKESSKAIIVGGILAAFNACHP